MLKIIKIRLIFKKKGMKKVKKLFFGFILLFLIGCANGVEISTTEDDRENQMSTQIMFNGSSTLAPVIATIAADFNEQYTTWNYVNPDFPKEPITIYISSGGSGQGVSAVINQTTDFGMLAREVRENEQEEIPNLQQYLVGIDALTIAINPENPLWEIREGLSTEEIVSIFSGEYKTWQDLDEELPDDEINVIVRDIGGGAHEVFQNTIMGDEEVIATAIQAPSMGALIARISENRNAIGYASFGVANQNTDSLAILQVDGIEPSIENIVSGSYIIQRPLILIFSGEPSDIEHSFLDVILGEDGQAMMAEMGFIPVN